MHSFFLFHGVFLSFIVLSGVVSSNFAFFVVSSYFLLYDFLIFSVLFYPGIY